MEYVEPPPPWEEGRQGILNALEAQMPAHTFKTPVPVVARIVWEHDGEEQVETEALGWTDRRRVRAATRQPVEVHLDLATRQRRQTAQPFLGVEHGRLRPWSTCLPDWPS